MTKMNLIDRAVAAVSPERGLRRAAARQGLELINSGYGNYGASTTKKSMRGCGSGVEMLTWVSPLQPVR